MKLSISLKITIIIFIAVFVTAISINLFSIQTISLTLRDQITAELSRDGFFLMEEIDRFMFDRSSDIDLLTSKENKIMNLDLHNATEISHYLRDFESKRKSYASISIYNLSGIKIGDTRGVGMYKNYKDSPFFKNAIKGDIYSDPRPILSQDLNVPVLHFSGPLRSTDGTIIGVVATMVPVTRINDIVREIKGPLETYEKKVDLLDRDGLILFSNHDKGRVLKQRLSGWEIFKLASKSDKGIETKIGIHENKETLFVGVKQKGFLGYKGHGWVLVTSIATADVFKPVDDLQKKSLIVALIILVWSIPLSLFLARSLSIPVLKLKNAANEVAKGNLDYKISINTQDEIGELSKTFEQMALDLKESREKIEKHSGELKKQVEERTKQLQEKVKELELSKLATMNIMEDMDDGNRQLIVAQEKLEASVQELKKLDVQKDQFISIAAHELKTPLTSIQGFADLLSKKKVSENANLRNKYLGIIFRDTKRLGELISNILELSRMDIGTLKMAYQDVKVADLVAEVKEQMDIIIKNKKLNSIYNIEDNLPAISLDKDRTVQIISNLINNAIHYTDEGTITIDVRKSNNDILFSVSDTGFGIPKDQQEKIFDRFYQVDNPLTRKIGGTGLGLSLCQGFVESMEGEIWVKSEEGKGAAFYFTIPIEKSEIKHDVDIFKKSKRKDAKSADKNKDIIEE